MWRRTALAAGVLVLGAGACSLIAGLDWLDFDGGAACSASMPCQSQGPCVVTSCDAAGTCESKPLRDGTPTPRPLHRPGGCVTAVCVGGIPSTPPRAAGVACKGAGVCDGMGSCVGCLRDADCAGTSPTDECRHPACQPVHTCDCRRATCDGMGGKTSVPDNADLPVDGACGPIAPMTDPDSQCAPYTCSNSACLSSCGTDDAACAAADYCDGAGAGACVAKRGFGLPCIANHECLSGMCVALSYQ